MKKSGNSVTNDAEKEEKEKQELKEKEHKIRQFAFIYIFL